jgi:hypothetical protein
MIIKRINLVGVILLILISGCTKKDDLTLPVKVHFKIGISQNNSLINEYLDFSDCRIGIQNIKFEGKREIGTDIYFETDPEIYFQSISLAQDPTQICTFDIPQGVYNSMKWDLSMICLETDELAEDQDVSWPCVGIIISGYYTYLNGSVIPFIFAIDAPEQFRVISHDPEGNSSITLSVNKEYEAIVYFAPAKAFGAISRESFETAKISGDSLNPVIIISSSENTSLYEILIYRIFLSASVLVK